MNGIWAGCLKGDMRAFEAFYNQNYLLLYNYGKKIIDDPEAIKDCIQEFFIKLILNHKNLSPTTHIKFYLLKAFRYKLYDYIGQQNSYENLESYENHFHTGDLFHELYDSEIEPGSNLYFLTKAIEELPPTQQEIIYLYYIQELSHKEIAELMNINYQSSKTHLYRAITKLKTIYSKINS